MSYPKTWRIGPARTRHGWTIIGDAGGPTHGFTAVKLLRNDGNGCHAAVRVDYTEDSHGNPVKYFAVFGVFYADGVSEGALKCCDVPPDAEDWEKVYAEISFNGADDQDSDTNVWKLWRRIKRGWK